ncbi:Thioesterase/thiol ester dehydrase-isomerase [Dentipellis sp. KUC8613]|nr:Thioesterase/thiol ester dehydrase-isomerase [Dentipellis sp. KUC8613]
MSSLALLQRASRSRPGRRFFTSAPPPNPPPTPKSALRTLRTISLFSAGAVATYTVGALYPPTPLTYISPRIAPPPPDPTHPAAQAYVADLEAELQRLPILRKHRARGTTVTDEDASRNEGDAEQRVQDEDKNAWYETRPYLSLPPENAANSLTAGALRGPGRLALPPLVRARADETESWIFIHVGRGLCGHEGIVHGGLLATLLDEGLARTAIMNLPDKVGVTANLSINYKAPTRADQFIVLKTRLVEAKGRKVRVEGVVEDMSGTKLVEASALFVQPKYAKLLNSKGIRRALGEPMPPPPQGDPDEMLPHPGHGSAGKPSSA